MCEDKGDDTVSVLSPYCHDQAYLYYYYICIVFLGYFQIARSNIYQD